ncbi:MULTISPECIES: choice-of-anchor tandem repeat GloVer-containing protein [unclassified Bradyrhizobium]|uniref:choice-of-anchor tandem repeat GloVer-containing protein n=1 Tax=unclassified Bradyrhizobium TaxID=2631580 RepID=UPI002916F7C4|nr:MULTISPECIES: choice-of-anchor tandem repeat GloVer-containing protein [unclassified Bradyrhizobium]
MLNRILMSPVTPSFGPTRMAVQAISPALERKSLSARKWMLGLAAVAGLTFAAAVVALIVTRSERYEVIQTFAAVGHGAKVPMGLTVDKVGNLYGTTWTGGLGGWGTIFELVPPSFLGSRWENRILSNVDGRTIGTGPIWSMIGQDGDLYGVTSDDETLYKFKFSDRGWGEPIPLYRFAERLSPLGTALPELMSDTSGSLYGATTGRDGADAGTVFKLSPGQDGWTMTVLHRFGGDNDGAYPNGGLAMDRTGALYGTTSGGGKDGIGTVFKLTPTDHGWEESVIHTFRQLDGSSCYGGCLPVAGLTLATDGTLYGTTGAGGKFGGGVVFSLTPSGSGGWSQQVLYNFKREVGDGQVPNSRLVFGRFGAIYGTTKSGGDRPDTNGFGTVFKLVPTATGWREVVLHCFAGAADGGAPTGTLIRDASGNVFGTTQGGARSGAPNNGTVFEIVAGGAFSEPDPRSPTGPIQLIPHAP